MDEERLGLNGEEAARPCGRCGQEVPAQAMECPECGFWASSFELCPGCFEWFDTEQSRACPSCGKPHEDDRLYSGVKVGGHMWSAVPDTKAGGVLFWTTDKGAKDSRRFATLEPEAMPSQEDLQDVALFRRLFESAKPARNPLWWTILGWGVLFPAAMVTELVRAAPVLAILVLAIPASLVVLGVSKVVEGLAGVVTCLAPFVLLGLVGALASLTLGRTSQKCRVCGATMYYAFLTGGPAQLRCPNGDDDPRACATCHLPRRRDFEGKVRCFNCDPPATLHPQGQS